MAVDDTTTNVKTIFFIRVIAGKVVDMVKAVERAVERADGRADET